jgi:hypothetical protein
MRTPGVWKRPLVHFAKRAAYERSEAQGSSPETSSSP